MDHEGWWRCDGVVKLDGAEGMRGVRMSWINRVEDGMKGQRGSRFYRG